MNCSVVMTLPTSTTNITGLRIIQGGFNFTTESIIACLTICGFQTASFLLCLIMLAMSDKLQFVVVSTNVLFRSRQTEVCRTSKSLSCIHQQMLDNRPQAQHREESQRS